MRLWLGVSLGHHLHFRSADVDQLARLRLRRPDVDVATGGKLVHRDEPLAVRMRRVAAGHDQVTGAVMGRDLIKHGFVHVLALIIRPRRQLPFCDVRIDEHRGVSVSRPVVLGVQRAQPDRHLAFHDSLVFKNRHTAEVAFEGLVVDRAEQLFEIHHRHRRLELAAIGEPLAARINIDTVRRFADRQEVENPGHLRRIEHRHPVHFLRFAVSHGLRRSFPVHDRRKITVLLAGVRFQNVMCHLGVVARPEGPAAARAFPG